MKPELKLVDDIDIQDAMTEVVRDECVDRLEDMHQKEVATCKKEQTRIRRQIKTDNADFDEQIKSLQTRKAAVEDAHLAEIARLRRREKAAQAYLDAFAEAAE